jgi:tRNA-guanine family transglycosylase
VTELKKIPFGSHTILSPTLFASYRMGDFPVAGLKFHPWEITDTEALLINAYDFMRPKYRAVINNGWDPGLKLDFPNKPILVDSGAYYFVKKKDVSVTASEILRIQTKAKADVGVVLDHPFPPEAKDKGRRISTTLRHTEEMLAEHALSSSNMTIMPVIHGHSTRSLRSCINRLAAIHQKLGYGDLDQVGIGSVAPLAQRKNMRLAFKIISTVRAELPKSYIHCFSMGSALSMMLAFLSGADSVDSQSWVVSAAFKNAQLPGHYVRRMARREYASNKAFKASMGLFAARLKFLIEEDEFYVKDWTNGERLPLVSLGDCLDYTNDLIDVRSNENIHNRACHNLWVFNFEVKQLRKSMQNDKRDAFIRSRLRDTQYIHFLEAR